MAYDDGDRVITWEYLDVHEPAREFDARDFERVGELALFGWSVMRKIIKKAKKKAPAEKITVWLKFTVEAYEARDQTGEVRANCIITRSGGGRLGVRTHQPCIRVQPGGTAYYRDEPPDGL